MTIARARGGVSALTLALAAIVVVLDSHAAAQHGVAPTRLDCQSMACAEVLPGAVRFVREEGHAFETGYDADGRPVGWVALSNEIVDVPAYSGRPVVVLFGLDQDATITAARVAHHSEPILLAGIPESQLTGFVEWYGGHRAIEHISVGRATRRGRTALVERRTDEGVESQTFAAIDVISGATVTALAANRTILEAARRVGEQVGVVDRDAERAGRFVADGEPWSWARMEREGVFGRLTVTHEEMGLPPQGEPFIDLWFTIADAPAVGLGLLPRGNYEHLVAQLEPGQHVVVVFGRGTTSFKGSAFVRGGIFDRVRVQQGLQEIQFRDTDYLNVGRAAAPDAPRFREGAAFITRSGPLDPGKPFELVFLGSHHDSRTAFSREFRSFEATHQLPSSVYWVEPLASDDPIWVRAWELRRVDVVVLSLWLALVCAIFALRRYTFRDARVLRWLHLGTMVVSLAYVGVYLGAQPSVTQMLTLVDVVVRGGDPALFLVDPLLFVGWIFIAVVSIVWGRGVFCGWVCPYGALSELARKLADLLKIPRFELPDRVHRRLRYLRYVILVVLVGTFLYSPIAGEQAAEIEPFKSTFLAPFWGREWYFVGWWLLLFALSTLMFLPFCRYLCPMGAGLALFGSLRLSGPRRRRYCASCKICQRGCEPRAIDDDGTIDPRECLSCMECEQTYHDRDRCPPLVGIDRLLAKTRATAARADDALDARDAERLAKLREQEERVPWRPGR